MFRKINAVFRPNHGPRYRDGHKALEEEYHNACTVKLVRSTSMLVVGEGRSRATPDRNGSALKRSKSSISVESKSELYCYRSREDQIWLYSQHQNCLEYLQDLVALRRQYTRSVSDLQAAELKKNQAPRSTKGRSPKPAAPSAVLSEEDTIEFFDAVIASCDPELRRKAYVDDGHADIDFIVATSTSEHDLHSNWVLRDPRRFSMDESRLSRCDSGPRPAARGKGGCGTTGVGRRLQRNPIHLPKVVESAFQTLRFKPKLKKKKEEERVG
ncbi:uncharacterized protein C13orf42 [Denticeps clupeoides]|uniref:uncharacterized protein C13orf42 n=1 Tax=Denticeps clupeoides TaxID=299321 RepID=UPI0010A44E38|nr:uncharacterized protein C13orf42 homolog [Denticeps clupeoides]